MADYHDAEWGTQSMTIAWFEYLSLGIFQAGLRGGRS
jgi:3-methyladenine DNA glycosylase Tag